MGKPKSKIQTNLDVINMASKTQLDFNWIKSATLKGKTSKKRPL